MLLITVQFNDYLCAGTASLTMEFETFLQQRFEMGSLALEQFDITGAKQAQHPPCHASLVGKEELDSVELFYVKRICRSGGDDDATPAELSGCKSMIGRFLFIGRLVSTVIAFHPSNAATKWSGLKLHHMKALNPTNTVVKNYASSITFQPAQNSVLRLEVLSDTSMRSVDEHSHVRKWFIILRRSGTSMNPISCTSRFAGRIARRTSTAECFAAADDADEVTYIKSLLEETLDSRTTKWTVDSRFTLSLSSTMKESEEAKNKILLPLHATSISCSLCQPFDGLLTSFIWLLPSKNNILLLKRN